MYTGKAEFTKIGASSTFLLRKNEVQILKSNSLPMGILKDVDIETFVKKLKEDDIIVMITDGLLELDDNSIEKERWIKDRLEEIDTKNPNEIANSILNEAKKIAKNVIKDDMTVMVARIWSKL